MLKDAAQQMPADDSCVHKVWRKIVYELLFELGGNAELIQQVVVKLHFKDRSGVASAVRVFMIALFITKTWKQPRWPSVGE